MTQLLILRGVSLIKFKHTLKPFYLHWTNLFLIQNDSPSMTRSPPVKSPSAIRRTDVIFINMRVTHYIFIDLNGCM